MCRCTRRLPCTSTQWTLLQFIKTHYNRSNANVLPSPSTELFILLFDFLFANVISEEGRKEQECCHYPKHQRHWKYTLSKAPARQGAVFMLFLESLCVHIIRVTVSYYCWQTKGDEQDTGKNKVKRVSLLVLAKVFYGFHVVIKITLVKLSSFVKSMWLQQRLSSSAANRGRSMCGLWGRHPTVGSWNIQCCVYGATTEESGPSKISIDGSFEADNIGRLRLEKIKKKCYSSDR